MKYHRYIIMPFLLLIVLLAGCTAKYKQKDVYRYLKKTYALKNVTVSTERTEFTGENSYADYIWEVTADDITFRVKDDYHWGLGTLTNSLTDANELIGKLDSKEELRQLYAELESFQAYAAEKGFDIPNSFSCHLLMQPSIRSDNTPNNIIDDGDSIGCVTNQLRNLV